jgi:hypothetical protein
VSEHEDILGALQRIENLLIEIADQTARKPAPALQLDLIEEPPIGSRVRDREGDEWIRAENGRWTLGRAHRVTNTWDTVLEFAPLALITEEKP